MLLHLTYPYIGIKQPHKNPHNQWKRMLVYTVLLTKEKKEKRERERESFSIPKKKQRGSYSGSRRFRAVAISLLDEHIRPFGVVCPTISMNIRFIWGRMWVFFLDDLGRL